MGRAQLNGVIYGRDDLFILFSEERIGCRFRDDAKAIGLVKDGRIRAAVVYDDFTPRSCMVSVASDGSRRWFTREFAIRAFAFPFIQCQFPRVTCMVSEHNADSLRFSRHLGWVEEGRLRRAGDKGEDTLLFGMLRSECRWLPSIGAA